MNQGLNNAGFDPLPDPLPPIQNTATEDTWRIPTTPPLNVAVELEAAPDGSPLHTIVIRVDLAGPALEDQHKGVLQARGRVPHTPGTEIAAYLDGFTADEWRASWTICEAPTGLGTRITSITRWRPSSANGIQDLGGRAARLHQSVARSLDPPPQRESGLDEGRVRLRLQ